MVFSLIPGCTQNGEGGDGKKLKTAAGIEVFTKFKSAVPTFQYC